jgi:hypothetical protein
MGQQTTFATSPSPILNATVYQTGFLTRFKQNLVKLNVWNTSVGMVKTFEYYDKDGNVISIDNRDLQTSPDNLWSVDDNEELLYNRNYFVTTQLRNKLFFLNYGIDASGNYPGYYLNKFDGVQYIKAGLAAPAVTCAQYNTAGIVRYVRCIMLRIGFDGELVSSAFTQFPVNNNTVTIGCANGTSGLIGSAQVVPSSVDQVNDFTAGISTLEDRSFIDIAAGSSWTYIAGTPNLWSAPIDYTVGTPALNVRIGSWVMFRPTLASRYFLYAMKVHSITGSFPNPTTVRFDATNAKGFNATTLNWDDISIPSTDTNFSSVSGIKYGTSYYMAVYSSTSANDGYLLNGIYPFMVNLSHTITLTTIATQNAFGQITVNLNEWYDTSTVKIPFLRQDIKGITNYANLLVAFTDEVIQFTDTSGGGCTEMVNGLSNFVPIGTEFGPITCVMGCEEFLFISRERRNYVLIGDIATGNINITECSDTGLGAWSARSAMPVKNGVVFMSREGIFFVNATGNIEPVSDQIQRLFGANREFNTDIDNIAFKPYLMTDPYDTSNMFIGNTVQWDGNIVSMKYDQDRNTIGILFCKKRVNNFQTNPGQNIPNTADSFCILGINLDTGALTEWKQDKYTQSGSEFDVPIHDFEFLPKYQGISGVEGKFKGSLMLAGDQAAFTLEDNTVTPTNTSKLMLSSWQTGEEPSLEKQVTQVKFFGQMSSCRIVHQENWEGFTSVSAISAPRTNVVYTQGPNAFEHKQRLNTSRPQAISIGFVPLDNNFSFEGYEVEWELIQEATKK